MKDGTFRNASELKDFIKSNKEHKLIADSLIELSVMRKNAFENMNVKVNYPSGLYAMKDGELIETNTRTGNGEYLLIDLNNKDLSGSTVSIPNEIGLWDFEDCDLRDTTLVLNALNIDYKEDTIKAGSEEIKYISYVEKGNVIAKCNMINDN